jgi:hypothetical protein
MGSLQTSVSPNLMRFLRGAMTRYKKKNPTDFRFPIWLAMNGGNDQGAAFFSDFKAGLQISGLPHKNFSLVIFDSHSDDTNC